MSFRGTWDSFIGGGSLVGAGLQVSKPIGRYLASSSLDYQSVRDSLGLSTHQLRGLLELTALVRSSWQLRGGAAYTASPRQRLDSVFLTADRNLGDRTAVRLSLSQSFGHAASTTIAAANTWRLKKADISFTAGYDTYYKDLRIGFNVSTSFGYDPMRRRYGLVGAGAANGGEMEVQAFVDANGDGRRDAGEEGVPNILVQGGRRPALTDADGVAMITGLGDGARARARLDLERVDDPYLVGPPPVVEIVPRPGRVAVVPYPMVSTSEVEIKAVFQRPDEPSRGLSALALQLIDGAGAVAAEGRTEYDGTLLLEGIKPGAYAVQIEPAQAARLKLALKDPVRIVVKAVGGFAGQTTATIVKSPDAP
jgi:hypothetical protein